ncbi:hypothetical protein ACJ2A9_21495 [Anaerobacillus sp. MEB173]|uniref:hypothetical protein n=1 Tax=Anaerobacillus sp. MEB173 TaxID=3383345 RepID=UPI003F903622
MSLEDQVLKEDLAMTVTLRNWAKYCAAQLSCAVRLGNFDDVDFWTYEYKRAVNDLKYYQFKKTESERKSGHA